MADAPEDDLVLDDVRSWVLEEGKPVSTTWLARQFAWPVRRAQACVALDSNPSATSSPLARLRPPTAWPPRLLDARRPRCRSRRVLARFAEAAATEVVVESVQTFISSLDGSLVVELDRDDAGRRSVPEGSVLLSRAVYAVWKRPEAGATADAAGAIRSDAITNETLRQARHLAHASTPTAERFRRNEAAGIRASSIARDGPRPTDLRPGTAPRGVPVDSRTFFSATPSATASGGPSAPTAGGGAKDGGTLHTSASAPAPASSKKGTLGSFFGSQSARSASTKPAPTRPDPARATSGTVARAEQAAGEDEGDEGEALSDHRSLLAKKLADADDDLDLDAITRKLRREDRDGDAAERPTKHTASRRTIDDDDADGEDDPRGNRGGASGGADRGSDDHDALFDKDEDGGGATSGPLRAEPSTSKPRNAVPDKSRTVSRSGAVHAPSRAPDEHERDGPKPGTAGPGSSRRKKLVQHTFMDERGYLVTEDRWEDAEDEPGPTDTKDPTPAPAPSHAKDRHPPASAPKPHAAGKPKQASLAGFFTRKA